MSEVSPSEEDTEERASLWGPTERCTPRGDDGHEPFCGGWLWWSHESQYSGSSQSDAFLPLLLLERLAASTHRTNLIYCSTIFEDTKYHVWERSKISEQVYVYYSKTFSEIVCIDKTRRLQKWVIDLNDNPHCQLNKKSALSDCQHHISSDMHNQSINWSINLSHWLHKQISKQQIYNREEILLLRTRGFNFSMTNHSKWSIHTCISVQVTERLLKFVGLWGCGSDGSEKSCHSKFTKW